MKDYLTKFIKAKKARLEELRSKIESSTSLDEVRSLGSEVESIQDEIREAEAQLVALDESRTNPATPAGVLNPLATYGAARTTPETRNYDPLDTPEYRKAFMDFVCRGVPIPDELRADAVTTTTDASAAIPTSLQNEIIRQLSSYGRLYSMVRHLNVQGGVEFPVLTLKPTAKWIADGSDSDAQKIQANTKVSFSYFGLECKIAQSLLTSIVTVDAFQAEFSTLATEAIIQALEIGIIKGTGSGQMLGVTKDTRVPAANSITLTSTDVASWSAWKKKVIAKIPKAYQGGIWVMSQGTFDGHIDGMVDSNGQPFGRVNYGITEGTTYRFAGKAVETVEPDVLADYDTAGTGDVFAVYFNPKDYAINSNMQLSVVIWTDNDTNQKKTKATVIVDGKLLDPNGVLLIKKGA